MAQNECTGTDEYTFVANPPLPTGGSYTPGTVVNMCFTLDGYTNVNANWVHSILPTFGPGYDLSTLMPSGQPVSCNGGTWVWSDSFNSCRTNGSDDGPFGPGWGFDSGAGLGAGCGATANDGDPGNNYGDGPGFCLRTFCWDITTVAPGASCVNEAFIVRVEVNPDFETGSFTSDACTEDEPLCWPQITNLVAEASPSCPGDPFTLTAIFDTESTCGINVEWTDASGNPIGTGTEITVDDEGTYFVTVNSEGCESLNGDVTAMWEAPNPTLDPEPFGEYCYGETVTITAGGGDDFLFESPSGDILVANQGFGVLTFEANDDNEGVWTVTYLNGSSCLDTRTVEIIVSDQLDAMAEVTPDPVCVGGDVTLTGSGAPPGGAYEWTLPNGFQRIGNPQTFTTEDPGINTATLTVYASDGICTETIQVQFEVIDAADAQADALPEMSCEGNDVELFAAGAGPGGSYLWSTGESSDIIIVQPTPTSQTYTVTVTTVDGCISEAEVTVEVQAILDAPIIDCEVINPSQLNFSWNADNTVDYYEIFLSTDGGATFTEVENNFTGNFYSLMGLNEGTNVVLRVIPYTNAQPDCPGAEGEASCATPVCPPLSAPVVFCERTTQDSIIFGWAPVDGATGYEVNVLSGPSGTLDGTNYLIGNLTFGQTVRISVTALGPEFCPGATSQPQECQAQACPEVTLTIDTPADTYCANNNNPAVDLEVTVNNPLNPTDTLWSGPGVVGNTFDPDLAGLGTHTVTVTVTDDNCPFTATVQFTVFAVPTATFTFTDTVCVNGLATLDYTGTADPANTTFDWNFDGGILAAGTDEGPLEVSWPTAGTYTVSLAVTEGECASMLVQNNIVVLDSLPRPLVNCVNPGLDNVTFEWVEDPAATGYQVTLISGMAGTQNGNTYTVTGLNEGDEVTIEVVALNDGVCSNSLPTRVTCQARSCGPVIVDIDQLPSDFCQDNTGNFLELSATVTDNVGMGTINWRGPGVSNDTFFIDAADIGSNEVIVDYAEDGCTYSDTVFFTVFPLPVAAFSIDNDLVCEAQTVTVNYTGASLIAGSSFVWDFAGGAASPGTGEGPHTVSWNTPGEKEISLTVIENGCPSIAFVDTVAVIAPLPAPAIACGGGSIDSVSFSWPEIPTALAYVITIDRGEPDTITETSLGIGGLLEGQLVEAIIYALGSDPCGNGPRDTVVCEAEVCPSLAVEIDDANPDFCQDGTGMDFHVLGIAQNSGSGLGTYAWEGTGVSNDTFFYGSLPPGTYEVRVAYTEGECDYGDTVDFNVFPLVTSDFDLSTGPICTNQTATVTYQGGSNASATYNWDFAGGTAVPGTGPGPHTVSWSAAGTYEVRLTVVDGVCNSAETSHSIVVEAPLTAPAPMCDTSTLNTVEFDWVAVTDAIGYEIIVDGGTPDTVTELSYLISGLTPSQSVDISIRALGDGPCGDSPTATLTCQTLDCPTFTFDFAANPMAFCLDTTSNQSFALTAIATGGSGMNATFSWSGPGVSGGVFDPAQAGLGRHTVVLDYGEIGPCVGSDSFEISVFEIPVADFSLSTTTACTDQLVTVIFSGTAPAGSVYDWSLGDTTLTGPGPHTVSSPTAGPLAINLTMSANGCTNTATEQIISIIEPLPAPEVSCAGSSLQTTTFSWTAVEPNLGYEVTLNNGLPIIVNDTFLLVDNLAPDADVFISVLALSDSPCGNSPADTTTCSADPCPEISVSIDVATQDFCLTPDVQRIALGLSSSGGDMTGTFTVSGAGVIEENGTFFFDPMLADTGSHQIVVDYVETGNCSGSDSITMNVFALPVPTILVTDDEICL
ncbi:MAG: PKD domain-containing protein, partial [Bacteroidota bacterium]